MKISVDEKLFFFTLLLKKNFFVT